MSYSTDAIRALYTIGGWCTTCLVYAIAFAIKTTGDIGESLVWVSPAIQCSSMPREHLYLPYFRKLCYSSDGFISLDTAIPYVVYWYEVYKETTFITTYEWLLMASVLILVLVTSIEEVSMLSVVRWRINMRRLLHSVTFSWSVSGLFQYVTFIASITFVCSLPSISYLTGVYLLSSCVHSYTKPLPLKAVLVQPIANRLVPEAATANPLFKRVDDKKFASSAKIVSLAAEEAFPIGQCTFVKVGDLCNYYLITAKHVVAGRKKLAVYKKGLTFRLDDLTFEPYGQDNVLIPFTLDKASQLGMKACAVDQLAFSSIVTIRAINDDDACVTGSGAVTSLRRPELEGRHQYSGNYSSIASYSGAGLFQNDKLVAVHQGTFKHKDATTNSHINYFETITALAPIRKINKNPLLVVDEPELPIPDSDSDSDDDDSTQDTPREVSIHKSSSSPLLPEAYAETYSTEHSYEKFNDWDYPDMKRHLKSYGRAWLVDEDLGWLEEATEPNSNYYDPAFDDEIREVFAQGYGMHSNQMKAARRKFYAKVNRKETVALPSEVQVPFVPLSILRSTPVAAVSSAEVKSNGSRTQAKPGVSETPLVSDSSSPKVTTTTPKVTALLTKSGVVIPVEQPKPTPSPTLVQPSQPSQADMATQLTKLMQMMSRSNNTLIELQKQVESLKTRSQIPICAPLSSVSTAPSTPPPVAVLTPVLKEKKRRQKPKAVVPTA